MCGCGRGCLRVGADCGNCGGGCGRRRGAVAAVVGDHLEGRGREKRYENRLFFLFLSIPLLPYPNTK